MPGATYSFQSEKALEILGKVEMLVVAQPGVTRVALAARLGLESSTVGVYLRELHKREKVFLKRGESGNTNIVTWWPGINPAPNKLRVRPRSEKDRRQFKQSTVTSWPANQVRDDFALPVAFFRRTP